MYTNLKLNQGTRLGLREARLSLAGLDLLVHR